MVASCPGTGLCGGEPDLIKGPVRLGNLELVGLAPLPPFREFRVVKVGQQSPS